MKKFVLASVFTVALVGFVMADEFVASVEKVDAKAGTITYIRGNYAQRKAAGEKAPDPVTATLAKGCKIVKGEMDLASANGFKAGEALEKGLENEFFAPKAKADPDKADKIGFKFVELTIADEDKGDVKKGQVTQILVPNFEVKKGGKGKGGNFKGGKGGQ
jgi:hypothetical protein